MSYSIRRSIRNASKIASIKISQLATDDEAFDNSNGIPVVLLDSSPSNSKTRYASKTAPLTPRESPTLNTSSKYIGTVSMLRHYLQLVNSTHDEEEKINICCTIYETLVKDPTILIYEPEFRKVVLSKMDDMEKLITLRRLNVTKTPFKAHTEELRNIIHSRIRVKKTRDAMLKNLTELNTMFNDYTSWSRLDKFRITMSSLRKTIDNLKAYPEYVA